MSLRDDHIETIGSLAKSGRGYVLTQPVWIQELSCYYDQHCEVIYGRATVSVKFGDGGIRVMHLSEFDMLGATGRIMEIKNQAWWIYSNSHKKKNKKYFLIASAK